MHTTFPSRSSFVSSPAVQEDSNSSHRIRTPGTKLSTRPASSSFSARAVSKHNHSLFSVDLAAFQTKELMNSIWISAIGTEEEPTQMCEDICMVGERGRHRRVSPQLTFIPLKFAIPWINTAGPRIFHSGKLTPITSLLASKRAVIVPHNSWMGKVPRQTAYTLLKSSEGL